MKLHEFTDRLYAMGGIEQEEKKRRILNESTDRYGVNVTVDTYFSDEEELADIEEAARNLNVRVIDVDIYSDDSANITFRGHKEDIIKLFDTELYIDPNDYPELSENAYEEAEDTLDMYESLTEARNPENDAANTAIRKWANGRGRRSLNKEDKRALDDKGVYFDSMYVSGVDEPTVDTKTSSMTRSEVKDLHPDYDIVGKLNSTKKLSSDDQELDTNFFRGDIWGQNMEKPDPKDTSKMSYNQYKKLHPYAQARRELKTNKDILNRAQERVNDAQKEVDRLQQNRSEIMDEIKKKHMARKNESIELNESKQGLIDYFYKLVMTFDMDPDEQVDYLLGYMNESELADAIDDFKEYMEIDELDEAVDLATDDLKKDFLSMCNEYNLDKDKIINALLKVIGNHAIKVLMLNIEKHFNKNK